MPRDTTSLGNNFYLIYVLKNVYRSKLGPIGLCCENVQFLLILRYRQNKIKSFKQSYSTGRQTKYTNAS